MMSVSITQSILLAARRCLLDDAGGYPDNTRAASGGEHQGGDVDPIACLDLAHP